MLINRAFTVLICAVLLAPSVISLLAFGVEINLVYSVVVLIACVMMWARSIKYHPFYAGLTAISLTLLPYPLWLYGDGSGRWSIRWSNEIFLVSQVEYLLLLLWNIGLVALLHYFATRIRGHGS